jgi:hypothetical protein
MGVFISPYLDTRGRGESHRCSPVLHNKVSPAEGITRVPRGFSRSSAGREETGRLVERGRDFCCFDGPELVAMASEGAEELRGMRRMGGAGKRVDLIEVLESVEPAPRGSLPACTCQILDRSPRRHRYTTTPSAAAATILPLLRLPARPHLPSLVRSKHSPHPPTSLENCLPSLLHPHELINRPCSPPGSNSTRRSPEAATRIPSFSSGSGSSRPSTLVAEHADDMEDEG